MREIVEEFEGSLMTDNLSEKNLQVSVRVKQHKIRTERRKMSDVSAGINLLMYEQNHGLRIKRMWNYVKRLFRKVREKWFFPVVDSQKEIQILLL